MGGDGTLLHACSLFQDRHTPPILAINLGYKGALVPFNGKNITETVQLIASRPEKFAIIEKNRLEVLYRCKSDHSLQSAVATNEISLISSEPCKTVLLQVHVDNNIINDNLMADGILIASCFGSTGYNLSIGGPIMDAHLESEAMVMSPISPIFIANCPVVLSSHRQVKIGLKKDSHSNAALCIDGVTIAMLESPLLQDIPTKQKKDPDDQCLEEINTIEIKKSSFFVRLIVPSSAIDQLKTQINSCISKNCLQ
ncbi:MAG: NADH kinase pos5 [Paramarteilia canceri]